MWDRTHALVERRGREFASAVITLSTPSDAERHAISGLFGRARAAGASLRIRLVDLDAALRGGPLSLGLIDTLALLGRPVRDRAREAADLDRSIEDALNALGESSLAGEPWFVAWLEGIGADGTLRRLVGARRSDTLILARDAFEGLPVDGMPLPVFAAQVTGSTKGLDIGELSSLILRGLALRASVARPSNAAERRALWESFGVVADDLASDVLVLNLPSIGRSRLDEWIRGAAADGVPLRVTLQQLSIYRLASRPARIWICENPAVMRAAAQQLGARCAPILCTEGRPSTAFDRLVDALGRFGCEFAYHGDFDWPGLRIAAAVRARHGTAMWRMSAADYQAALATTDAESLSELGAPAFAAPWDPALTRVMSESGRAIYEESVVDVLLQDLIATRAPMPSTQARATVRDLVTLARCAHRVTLDRRGDVDARLPVSPFVELLWTRTMLHESTMVRSHNAEIIDAAAPFDVRRSRTRELMQSGAASIGGALLDIGDLCGDVPLLVKQDGVSELGNFIYVPAIAEGDDITTSFELDERSAMRLCAFAELLGHTQGHRPAHGIVVATQGEREVELDAFWPRYLELRRRARRVLLGIEQTRPGLKAECRLCRWRVKCHDDLVAADDLTLISSVGEAERDRLERLEVKTADALADCAAEKLVASGIGKRRASTLVRAASVRRSKEPAVVAPWTRPQAALEIVYDIENDALDPFVYLHGLLLRTLTSPAEPIDKYEPLCSRLPETEAELWARFLARVEALEDVSSYCVYVYGSHERTVLRRLARMYGGTAALDRFVDRLIDVHDAVRATVVLPTESTSLKAVATWLGFKWRDAEPTGAGSIAWWSEYARDPIANTAALQRVLSYNEDDLRATILIVDWLSSLKGS